MDKRACLNRAWVSALPIATLSLTGLALSPCAHAQDDYWLDIPQGDERVRPSANGGSAHSLDEAQRSHTGVTLGRVGAHDIPPSHQVQRGDTLWDITQRFYGDPYRWPQIWALNPEITNPHWIYPDQDVRLLPEGAPPMVAEAVGSISGGQARVVVREGVQLGTVFLREQGWLDTAAFEQAGTIVGSPDDHMMLTTFDSVYIAFDNLPAGTAPLGDYTIFREVAADRRNQGEEGTLVRILGSVRVDAWDAESETARGTVTEALDPIERGERVAFVPRRFDVVPPTRSDIDLESQIVATLSPNTMIVDQQVVFVPIGEQEGVRVGHRFFIVRSGDEWREQLSHSQEEEYAQDLPGRPDEYPDEVIAEARAVSLRPHSAGLLVTRARRPVSVGDRAQLRAGY